MVWFTRLRIVRCINSSTKDTIQLLLWGHFPVLPLGDPFVYAGLRGWFRSGLNVLEITPKTLELKASFGLGASLLGTPTPYPYSDLGALWIRR